MHPWLYLVDSESTIPRHLSEWFHLHAKLRSQQRALRKQHPKTKNRVFMLSLMLIAVVDNLLEAYEVSELESSLAVCDASNFDDVFAMVDKTKERYLFAVLDKDKVACLWQLRQLYLHLARRCDTGLPKSTVYGKQASQTIEALRQEQANREARLSCLFARLEHAD